MVRSSDLLINTGMTAGIAVIAALAAVASQVVLPAVALVSGLGVVFKAWEAAVVNPSL
ncbi:hypothetical protein SAMN02745127_01621 [Oceanospirillum multiglobuliferum]|uniref:hypothetical protein n=1 Tax=Oceanospirillum multiglobuliferum TaxID=64969 RepID=UPI0009D1536E|nr:hypothetical protein [Oceanospirillum multiglobuliferum]SJZ94804.1 hypothetical protein SAMN02745127_01621 [Oceanospirillum multiglobuliferum]